VTLFLVQGDKNDFEIVEASSARNCLPLSCNRS